MDKVITPEQRAAVEAIREKIAPIARLLDAPPMHWIAGADQGFNYCFACAEIEVAAIEAKSPGSYACIDGGWDAKHESDGSATCKGCCRILGYSLTKCGIESEVDHFIGTVIESPLLPSSAYEIEAILDGIEYCKDQTLIADAISIGREALASIEKSEQFDNLVTMRWADDGGSMHVAR